VKVVYIAHPGNEEPWYTDFNTALGDRFPHAVLDRDAPLAPQFKGVRVVVDQGGQATRPMIDAGAEAGVVLWQAVTTGLDHTDVDYILSRGIRLAHTPGPFSAVALAEHSLFLMLVIAKKFRDAERNLRVGVMYHPLNEELAGSTLGVVGLGASGKELARRAKAFEMRVIALDAFAVPAEELAEVGVERFGGPETLDDLLRDSDYVSLHVPLTSATRHLIDAEKLALMKPTAVLINVARGEIVDEAALTDALLAGRLGGAGIDVFSREPPDTSGPLFQLDNVISTPHVAGTTFGTSRRRGEASVENIVRIDAGLPPLFEVTSAR
jgi:phosphoglycerate dehydrogenase-like enzyme